MYFFQFPFEMMLIMFYHAGKFLPMKTMLGPRYDDMVPEENRFHPSMLSNYLKSLKVCVCAEPLRTTCRALLSERKRSMAVLGE